MSFNWSAIGNTLSGISGALQGAGLTPGSANYNTALSTLGGLISSNPNSTAELALCAQILQFASNPAIVDKLVTSLIVEQGLPPAAASLAMTLMQPGTDIPTRVLQIEQLIKGN